MFTEEVTLEGLPYRFTFYWNTREEAWFMDISDREENLIIAGIKLVISHPVKQQYVEAELPPGDFIVVDTNIATSRDEPARDDFVQARNLNLLYLTEAEMELAATGGLSATI